MQIKNSVLTFPATVFTMGTTNRKAPRRWFILPLCLMLGACGSAPVSNVTSRAVTPAISQQGPIKTFTNPNPLPPARANRDIAADFLDLTFALESGSNLSRFTRFEGPVTVRVTGAPPSTLIPDLNRLVHRLRAEALIDISHVRGGAANITIEAVSRKDIHKYLPKAACFVVPNISSLSEYHTARRGNNTNWGSLRQRTKLAIFVPNDVSPQETRDCLHEELAQALGPPNDLYRLSDSIFNDDNMNTVLTGFDMLILRVTYQPELHSGMTRQQVEYILPGILSRLNPRGDNMSPRYPKKTTRAWKTATMTALDPGTGASRRLRAANQALAISMTQGWHDHRTGFSHYILGRLYKDINPEKSVKHFRSALHYYRRTPGTALHQANTATRLAAWLIHAGKAQEALDLVTPYIAAAKRFEDAALLANLMLLRAESLDILGHKGEAQALRLDSLGWARYGFGTDWELRPKLYKRSSEISPANTNG